ncbi:MAG TPA: aminotransferase class V-fold PLP-dependent enzyme, partial [Thermoanaerobaculia bacterium]|nr:aminotransferase class V-fold PLP-dependent enzyme [Thermoanaerobaculia bacterium]
MTNFDSTSGSPGQVRFFNPGPVWVRPQVLQALTGPMLSHRSQAFMDLYGRILEKLPKVFRTARKAHTLATSATGVWESALVSCVEGPVLALSNGAFSGKWGEMASRLGLETDVLKFEWGQSVKPDAVKKKLAEKKYAAVTVVHSETSTGVLSDLAAIAKVVHENSDALLFADAVTSVAGTRVETDEWSLDVVLTGSQKAFALPP